MADNEKVNISKFFGSFFKLLPWVKDIRTICAIVIIAFVGFTLWRAYGMKTQAQSQNARVIVLPFSFSTVHFTNAPQQQQKQEVKKRPWWLPILFVEGYGFSEGSSGSSNLSSRTGIGGRAGAKLEF